MTDTQVQNLTALTTASDEDVLYIVDDPTGTPLSRKITKANLLKALGTPESGVLTNCTGTPTLTLTNSTGLPLAGLSTTTASRALVSNGSGVISPATTTSTEIGYVNGVTSAIQTQINSKAPIDSPTFTTQVTSPKTLMTGRHQWAKGADVASASALSLGTDGNFFDITGTTTINTISPTNWQAGSTVILQFDGTLTVTHNSGGVNDIILQSGTNKSCVAGSILQLTFNGTDWLESGGGAGGGGGSDTPWTANHDFDTFYYDMQIQSAPADPATNNVRFYVKTIDANNEGLFCKIKKAGGFVELQIA